MTTAATASAAATTATPAAATPSNDAGFGYAHKSGNGYTFIVDGKHYTALKNDKAGGNEKAPDFNVVVFGEDNKAKRVGAAWAGETKQGRVKLNLKIDKTYYTVVKRDKKEGASAKQADFTIFK